MYEAFFGCKERPFELTPNPRYLCRTPGHREALSSLEYGLASGRGITLLLGDAGMGKTTLIRTALAHLNTDSLCVTLSNPTLSLPDFFRFLAEHFGLSQDAAVSKTVLLRELEALLRDRHARGALTALVVDEAQSLSVELLEELRLLTNIETDELKLLPLVLAGQPELSTRLNDSSLRQLKQRVALRCHLRPFDLQETATYIASRIRVAGGDSAQIFTREAVRTIYEHSGGIPRTISVLCDNALISGFAVGQRPVTRAVVMEVCKDFDLQQTSEASLAARQASGFLIKSVTAASPQEPATQTTSVDVTPSEAPTEPELLASQSGGKRRRFIFF